MGARQPAGHGPARRRIATDESGVSAIEFALIAPVLIVMFMALCDLCSAVMTQLHVDRAAEGTGDVVATYTSLQKSDMINMFTAASQFMQPYSSAPLNVRITDVYSTGNNTAKVYWSCALNNNAATNTFQPYDLNTVVTTTPTGAPVGALVTTSQYFPSATNSGFIMVEVNYTFSSPSNYIIKNTPLMTSTFYMQPRQGLYVGFPWSGGSTLPPAPNSTTTSSSTTLTNTATCNYRQ